HGAPAPAPGALPAASPGSHAARRLPGHATQEESRMRVTTLQSTTLATVIYDEAREVLQLEFLSRALYQYLGVPREVHEALLSAPSKGRYFNKPIRGRFPFARISPAPSPGPEVPAPDRA